MSLLFVPHDVIEYMMWHMYSISIDVESVNYFLRRQIPWEDLGMKKCEIILN